MPCTNITMSLENTLVKVSFAGPHISCMYPCVLPMAGSIAPWKATVPLPTASTENLSPVREHRGYLWDELIAGGSTLGGFAEGGTVDRSFGTAGSTLGGEWVSMLCRGVGDGVFARVLLGGGVGVGVGVLATEKLLVNLWIASMVWVPK